MAPTSGSGVVPTSTVDLWGSSLHYSRRYAFTFCSFAPSGGISGLSLLLLLGLITCLSGIRVLWLVFLGPNVTPPSVMGVRFLVAPWKPALVPQTVVQVALIRATRLLLGFISLDQVCLTQIGLDLKGLLFFEWLQGTRAEVINGFPHQVSEVGHASGLSWYTWHMPWTCTAHTYRVSRMTSGAPAGSAGQPSPYVTSGKHTLHTLEHPAEKRRKG